MHIIKSHRRRTLKQEPPKPKFEASGLPVLPYAHKKDEQTFQTEEYVVSPPALWVVDESGNVWTLGQNMQYGPRGEFAFNVLVNGYETGEVASRVERRKGKVRIFSLTGWKYWNGRSFI